MDNLDLEFQKAVQKVRNTSNIPNTPQTNAPSDQVRLEFYGYYKQATKGDVEDTPPSRFWFKARAKWDAWNAMRGLTKAKAKQCYILLTKEYMS